MESAPVSTLSPQTSWQQVVKSSPGLECMVKHMLANSQTAQKIKILPPAPPLPGYTWCTGPPGERGNIIQA